LTLIKCGVESIEREASMSSTRKYECGVCGRWKAADQMIYSTHTGRRFCASGRLCKRPRSRKVAA